MNFKKLIPLSDPRVNPHLRQTKNYIKGYNLDFGTYNECWKGSMATVVPTNGTIVWGVVWKIHASELPELEKYHRKKLAYVPINVTLQLESGDHIVTRTYVQTNTTHKTVPLENLPCKRRPSLSYLKTVIKGAEEANLPEKYTNMLKTIPVREKLKDVDGVF
ncbi:gamma-glutamylcyclotransferase isoform X2 [Aethina tumida]|uniref:gamma-glutamylcyclotransferase isoform X2 n=1 Tax=Aethina tumida TaxID=116153 RepID=UPI0021482C6A|nr:gamma-glutamylcyclotransferase isoform X2 [Aethina tumida]XP_049818584.1 gamma-glutamylcyclotransferase isoform X2 [Aethina tumida]